MLQTSYFMAYTKKGQIINSLIIHYMKKYTQRINSLYSVQSVNFSQSLTRRQVWDINNLSLSLNNIENKKYLRISKRASNVS